MVCFTSPDEAWFDKIKTSPHHPRLFMPVWECDEFQKAINELERDLDPPTPGLTSEEELRDVGMLHELLEHRYLLFGGVARDCLSTDEGYVEEREASIESTISKLTKVSDMLDPPLLRIGLVHYIPDPNNPRKYTYDCECKHLHKAVDGESCGSTVLRLKVARLE